MGNPVLRVLLVEDNPTDALLVRDVLETSTSAQIDITHVDCLDEALTQLKKAPFDITLLDPGLPDSQGIETCRRLHTNACVVPIIILTNNDDEELALRAIGTGAQDYFVKGKIDENVLVRAMWYAIERERADAALRESEARYRTLVEHAPFCIHEIDLNGRFLSVNSAGAKLFDLSDEQQLIGVPYLDCVSQEDHVRVQAFLSNAYQGEPSAFEFKRVGERPARVIAASFIPLMNPEGDTLKIMGISQDITDSKTKDEERLRSNKLESVGLLAGGIAHDFNNLLTGILGNISLGRVHN